MNFPLNNTLYIKILLNNVKNFCYVFNQTLQFRIYWFKINTCCTSKFVLNTTLPLFNNVFIIKCKFSVKQISLNQFLLCIADVTYVESWYNSEIERFNTTCITSSIFYTLKKFIKLTSRAIQHSALFFFLFLNTRV